MKGLTRVIKNRIPECRIIERADLSAYSFMRTGGIAQTVLLPPSAQILLDLTLLLNELKLSFHVIGRGSNILFSDGVIKTPLIKTTEACKIVFDGNTAYAESGALISQLAAECLKRSLSGLEFACGIPGSIGGAVTMNAGAFGKNVADTVKNVHTGSGALPNKQCLFAYRSSRFIKRKEVISAAEFEFSPGDSAQIREKVREYSQKRSKSQPKGHTLGSTFKNPTGFSAGFLIEQAGLKNFGYGGAAVSDKHANFIINRGGANSDDVFKLINYIKERVYKSSGVMLEEEIRIIGEF